MEHMSKLMAFNCRRLLWRELKMLQPFSPSPQACSEALQDLGINLGKLCDGSAFFLSWGKPSTARGCHISMMSIAYIPWSTLNLHAARSFCQCFGWRPSPCTLWNSSCTRAAPEAGAGLQSSSKTKQHTLCSFHFGRLWWLKVKLLNNNI